MIPKQLIPKLDLEGLTLLLHTRFKKTSKTEIEAPHSFDSNVYANNFANMVAVTPLSLSQTQ